jgi:GNAT superfamily N-acetyltransferase
MKWLVWQTLDRMNREVGSLMIIPFDADDDDAIAAAYRITATRRASDTPDLPPPCRYRHAVLMRQPLPGTSHHRFLARLDGEPAGWLDVAFTADNNLDNAVADLEVHPGYRRRGVGNALYLKAVEVARAGGRTRVIGNTVEQFAGGPARDGAGSAFATAVGAGAALREIRLKLELSQVDHAMLDRLLAAAYARADEYSLVHWRDRVPDEYVKDVAILGGRLMTDAPTGDLALDEVLDAEIVDVERIRGNEAAREAMGCRLYATGACDQSGHVVALSTLVMETTVPDHAWQAVTLVHPANRGHRLGTIVKIENLRYALAHEPPLASIDTWNAEANTHMIAINEAMGFRPVDTWVAWQREL